MRYCHAYLSAQGLVPSDEAGFKKALHQMWFSFYKRAGGLQDSCGFEVRFKHCLSPSLPASLSASLSLSLFLFIDSLRDKQSC